MNAEIIDAILELGEDSSDPTWYWLMVGGPHGASFTWGQTRSEPAGHIGIDHLSRRLIEEDANDATFLDKMHRVISLALLSENPSILIRAIQVAGVIGTEEELSSIEKHISNKYKTVRNNAKACTFYLKKRLR